MEHSLDQKGNCTEDDKTGYILHTVLNSNTGILKARGEGTIATAYRLSKALENTSRTVFPHLSGPQS